MPTLWIFLSFGVLSLLALLIYSFDKWQARRGSRRISERTLLLASFFGPAGAILGVLLVRHKSKKLSYLIKLSGIIIVSACAWVGVLYLKLKGA